MDNEGRQRGRCVLDYEQTLGYRQGRRKDEQCGGTIVYIVMNCRNGGRYLLMFLGLTDGVMICI